MQRILLNINYVGTAYHGWQKQSDGRATIQETVEKAVSRIACHPINLVSTGRTDAGVHALAQFAHFDTESIREPNSWIRGVNSFLPSDIAIHSAQVVPHDFHARFDAIRRSYRYVLFNHPIRPTFLKNKVGWIFIPLDIEPMKKAAQLLLGTQDFSSFRSSECQAHSPIRTMYHTDVYKYQDLICFDLEANGFLHHMVRNIVGALVFVGSGKISLDDFKELIDAQSREKAPSTFMADGLYLLKASYPEKFEIQSPQIPSWFWGKNDF